MFKQCLSLLILLSDCSDPSSIDNGFLTYTSSLFGDTANVTCDAGYVASVNVITCSENGAWSDCPVCRPVGKFMLQCNDMNPSEYRVYHAFK